MPKKHRVVIVGGGIAGLSACLELAHQGLDVTLIDQGVEVGGKIRQLQSQELGIDSGPTVFTMRWVFEELFKACDESFDLHIKSTPLPILARHFWGQEKLDLFADPSLSTQAIREFSNAKQAELFLKFCQTTKNVYESLESSYICAKRPTLTSMLKGLGLKGSKTLMGIGPFKNLWDALEYYFPDPRLRQLFARYATYCGSSPFLAPATLMLIAHVELQGVWSVDGGMIQIPKKIAELAISRGAKIIHSETIEKITITNHQATGVTLSDQTFLPADSIIFNGDVSALYDGLLGDDVKSAVPKSPTGRSLSAITWSVSTSGITLPLTRHNVFFDQEYANEFKDIFHLQTFPKTPTVYLCAQDRLNNETAPDLERMLLLVNAPAIGDSHPNPSEISRCQDQVQTLLSKSGLTLDLSSPATVRTTPWDFHQRFPATGGALYGMATHGWMSSFNRPSSQSSIRNLYLAGGSVHPGPGVPMATLSGRMAAATLMENLALTK
ncbi:1-hydroxycarotenoid 3,4-desaturase CrtD [Polynucleobacter kasalickyi]|uniref:1-hydroxycarotenoid 3,4-desaturase n=1 Tax=Polynucleobacter kasalickyi TaxID=1938817 RepID=A0A1W1Z1Q3_9BURK|nr:1-hydroxycarotenoid 3,4-desaturase CrtD [Polynucleobacter kasalickyi]SMC42359.1 1-hydroxycarotenoid 3,4-desaturase [Polynucleobacter kasalickyi]